MTDPQDRCAHCHHARHLHNFDSCNFLKADMTFCACACPTFVVEVELASRLHELGEVTPEEGRAITERLEGHGVLCGEDAERLVESLKDVAAPLEIERRQDAARDHLSRLSRRTRAPARVPPLPAERVAEIKLEIAEMRAVQTRIYHVGLKMPHGEWQAFAALVSVYASMCEIVLEQGYDYAFEAECAVVPEFKAKYLGEKFHRVFGPFYGNERWVDEFLEHARGLKR